MQLDDFALLHQQIVVWQERRFTIVTGAITLIAVLCGFILSDGKRSWTREQASSLVLLVLTSALLFAWYCGWQNAIIGAFLRTVREADASQLGWESGVTILNAKGDLSAYISLNKIIAITFLFTAIGAHAIFRLHCEKQDGKAAKYTFVVLAAIFSLVLLLTAFPRILTPNYDKEWEKIKVDFDSTKAQKP